MLVLALRNNMKVKQITMQGVAESEQRMSRAAKGNEKYGKDGMKALAKAGREGASDEKLDAIRDQHDNYDESIEEGAMSEIDLEMGEMMDKYIQRYKSGHMDADHLMHMMDKASNILARRHDMEPEQAHQFISDYVEQADNEEVVDEIMGGEAEIVKSDDTGVTYKDTATGVVTTLPPTMTGALAPNPQNPNQFTLNPQAVAPSDNMGKPKGPPVGAKVTLAPMSEVRQSRTVSSSNADLESMLRIAGLK